MLERTDRGAAGRIRRGWVPVERADVVIVGAGPAGMACGIAAALRGMRVRVVDAGTGPMDKACGEGLLPDAVESLRRLGVRAVGQRIAGIRFHGCGRVAEARFGVSCAGEAEFPGAGGLGIRRTELMRAMLERAQALGVEVCWGVAVRRLEEPGGRFVVGADGGQSRVRALAGLDGAEMCRVTTRRVGLRQHFAVAPWSDCVEVLWGDGAQAYVTPVGPAEVGVAFLSARKFAGMGAALGCFPGLRERLAGARTTSEARGAATVTRRLRRVTGTLAGGRAVALVGDASGSVDAITGEGMNLCFRQAEALAEAMLAGDLRAYEGAHRRILRVPRVMSRALLAMGGSGVARAGAMAVLAGCPGVFAGLLRVHAGGESRVAPRFPVNEAVCGGGASVVGSLPVREEYG